MIRTHSQTKIAFSKWNKKFLKWMDRFKALIKNYLMLMIT